jgi:hypothetical protein
MAISMTATTMNVRRVAANRAEWTAATRSGTPSEVGGRASRLGRAKPIAIGMSGPDAAC